MQTWKNLQLTSKETKAKTVMTEKEPKKESEMIAPAMGNRLVQPKMILLIWVVVMLLHVEHIYQKYYQILLRKKEK